MAQSPYCRWAKRRDGGGEWGGRVWAVEIGMAEAHGLN